MACKDHSRWIDALDAGTMAVRDAVLCPYQESIGGIVFATVVMLGVINVPIYVRQESPLIPMVITLSLAGIWVTEAAGIAQTLVGVVVLLGIGLGPVLLLRRVVR